MIACTWSLLLRLNYQSFAQGLGFGVQGLGFRDPRLARGAHDCVHLVSRVEGLEFKAQGLEFRVVCVSCPRRI
jgi:hypothetical protein